MSVPAQFKKKDPNLKLSKYNQYIIDLHKPNEVLPFFKEAVFAGYDDAYITKALIYDFGITEDKVPEIFAKGLAYIEDYKKEMWANFFLNEIPRQA